MHLKTLLAAVAAVAIMASAAPAYAFVGCVTIPTADNGPNVKQTGSSGSIGTHGGAQGPRLDLCDPRPTAYDDYYGLCEAAVYNITSLSERSPGAVYTDFKNGVVPDNHRKTLFGFPVGPVLLGPCGS
jgi:hypothetical protein